MLWLPLLDFPHSELGGSTLATAALQSYLEKQRLALGNAAFQAQYGLTAEEKQRLKEVPHAAGARTVRFRSPYAPACLLTM